MIYTRQKKMMTKKWMQILLIFSAILVFSRCDKFEGEQTVPSYLRIDSIGFYTDNNTQGSNKQKIVDAWVYVDDDLIGGFEIPALIPVLAEGPHKLEIRPGILLNGISDTRAPYPCLLPMTFSAFELFPDSVVIAYGTTTYQDNAEFVWMEDFEDASLAIKRSINSDTGIVRTDIPGVYTDEFSEYSGITYLDNYRRFAQLISDDGEGSGFVFDRGDFIFLELQYRNNIPMVVGVYIKLKDNTVQERPFLVVTPSDEWNKIYVNFTPIVNETNNADNYTVYIEAELADTVTEAYFMLDNVKLVTRPNL